MPVRVVKDSQYLTILTVMGIVQYGMSIKPQYHYINFMKRISSVGLFILCFLANYCGSVGYHVDSKDTIINLRYSFKMQIVINPGRFDLFTMQDSTFLSYYKNSIVMKLPVYESEMKMINSDSGVEFTNLGQPEKIRFRYILFNKNDSMGSLLDIDSVRTQSKINVDSLWRRRISFPAQVITKNIDSLVSVTESNGLRMEYYIAKLRPDASYPDSVILSYSGKLNRIPFSFSKELDSTRKMKLYRILYVYKPYFDASINANLPRREFRFEIDMAENDDFAAKLLKAKY